MSLDPPLIPTPAAHLTELSEDDIGTLQRVADLRRRFGAGIFPTTIGQRSHFRRLVRQGLLKFDNGARAIPDGSERLDGCDRVDDPVRLRSYNLTDTLE